MLNLIVYDATHVIIHTIFYVIFFAVGYFVGSKLAERNAKILEKRKENKTELYVNGLLFHFYPVSCE